MFVTWVVAGEVVVVEMVVGWCYPGNTDPVTQIALRFHLHEISIITPDLSEGEVFLLQKYCTEYMVWLTVK